MGKNWSPTAKVISLVVSVIVVVFSAVQLVYGLVYTPLEKKIETEGRKLVSIEKDNECAHTALNKCIVEYIIPMKEDISAIKARLNINGKGRVYE